MKGKELNVQALRQAEHRRFHGVAVDKLDCIRQTDSSYEWKKTNNN